MASAMTAVPLLPCPSIDETADFYRMLGFDVAHRQTRPNPYVAMRLDQLQLHFFGMPDFDPEQSYGSCLLLVPDTKALFERFAAGMRAAHGKLLLAGIPRITRPRTPTSGFSVVDPGGNWIRVFRHGESAPEEPAGRLARALSNAIRLGDSKGDPRQAAKILDGALAKAGDEDVTEALVYRAELAVRLDDLATARTVLDRIDALSDGGRGRVAEAVADLRRIAGHAGR